MDNSEFYIVPDAIFSKLTLFVCTYVAKLSNLHISFETLTKIIIDNLRDNILAIHSNFGHASQIGYEKYLIKNKKKKNNIPKRIRKVQGDGTCFNSAIEPIIKPITIIKEDKVYFIKCFPTTGETQIPGVINEDFSDGHEILEIFVNYLNTLPIKINDANIFIEYEGPKMVNYKFKINKNSDRILINLISLATYLQFIENNKLISSNSPTLQLNQLWNMIYPDYYIKETKFPFEDIKISFRIQINNRMPRINIFQEGKINILGAETHESAIYIYQFLTQIFTNNWKLLINVRPIKDNNH